MSEYEETDSLTLAVAKAIFGEFDNQPGDESPDSRWEEWADRTLWMRVSKAAIKAYELHQEAAIAQVIYPNRTKLYWDGEDVDPKDLKP